VLPPFYYYLLIAYAAMQNIYETIKAGLHFNKFELDELLFVEYTCPIPDEESGIWTQTDYIIHVLSGEKSWRTLEGLVTVKAGDTVYIKKGGSHIRQFFDDDFCMLSFFVTDHFIKNTLQQLEGKLKIETAELQHNQITIPIDNSPSLSAYFQSILQYFRSNEQPINTLLELKFRELLISLIMHKGNKGLLSYLTNLVSTDKPSIPYVMERNYYFNLSLVEFARLSHRSLSSFKRDFRKHYKTSPGKWLILKRLDHAAMLMHNNDSNISRIAYESGFEDTSHFSRAFKAKFGVSPLAYRKKFSE
jgi:AraC-like DNA-binding protein